MKNFSELTNREKGFWIGLIFFIIGILFSIYLLNKKNIEPFFQYLLFTVYLFPVLLISTLPPVIGYLLDCSKNKNLKGLIFGALILLILLFYLGLILPGMLRNINPKYYSLLFNIFH